MEHAPNQYTKNQYIITTDPSLSCQEIANELVELGEPINEIQEGSDSYIDEADEDIITVAENIIPKVYSKSVTSCMSKEPSLSKEEININIE